MLNKKHMSLAVAAILAACVPAVDVDEPVKEETVDVVKRYFNDNNAFIISRDLNNTTSAGAILNLDDLSVLETGLGEGTLSNDVVVQSDRHSIYLIDRGHGSFLSLIPTTPEDGFVETSVGATENPQAIVRVNDKLYIPRYESADLLVLDAVTKEKVTTVDLSKFSSPDDPYPEMSQAVSAEGKVWVTLQRLDRGGWPWLASTQPFEGSFIVSIDPESDTVVDEVKLTGLNPNTELDVDPKTGDLYAVSSTGASWGDPTGIELIDPKTAKAKGWLVEPTVFSGGILYASLTTESVYVVSTEGPDGNYDYDYTVLWKIDRESGIQTEVARSDAGYWGMVCLERTPNKLLAVCAGPGTRVTKPGIRVFDPETHEELTDVPIDVGLPPTGIVFFARPETETVSVPITQATNPITDTTK